MYESIIVGFLRGGLWKILSWVPQMTCYAQILNVSLNKGISEDAMLAKEKKKSPNWWMCLGKELSASLKNMHLQYWQSSIPITSRLKILFIFPSSRSSHLSSLLEFYKNTLKTSALQKKKKKKGLRQLIFWKMFVSLMFQLAEK